MTDDVNERVRENVKKTEELRQELRDNPRTVEMVQQGPGHRVLRMVNHDNKLRAASEQFLEEVYARASEVDPDNEYDWADLARGYLIGKGVPLSEITYSVCARLASGQLSDSV